MIGLQIAFLELGQLKLNLGYKSRLLKIPESERL